MDKTKQDYLQEVVETHKMANIDSLVAKYREKRDEIKEKIEGKYKSDIYSPINSGSFAKHTAINTKFDLDAVVPFKRDSFDTLKKMFDDVFDFLSKEYAYKATIRKQTVSIGVEFHQDNDGDKISLDIVPGREQNKDRYKEDKNLNLFVNSQYGALEASTYIKTNIDAQIQHIKAKENERRIIRLLKIWKTNSHENYKSFLLELIVIKAFDNTNITGNLWDKLKSVMQYIEDNITKENFTLKDPGNSGNNVIDTLDSNSRQTLCNTMNTIISNIESNEDNIKIYFPINKDFDGGYGLKSGFTAASIPPNNTRFG